MANEMTTQATPLDSWQDQYPEFDEHEFVMSLRHPESELQAFVAIHTTKSGRALGGTRMQVYPSEKAAIKDVLNLSRAMSYKCALANLPYGGAKGVIIAPSHQNNREARLASYAALVEKLNGLFRTGTDVGISDGDVALMAQHTSQMLGVVEPEKRGELSTSKAASLGVFYAMKAVLNELYGSADFRGKKVAIKGAGKLGEELARLVLEAGGEAYISDISPEKCASIVERMPTVRIVPNEEIHKQDVDIYAPCALGNEFTTQTIAELRCSAIAGGANNQLAVPDSGNLLHGRGILYVPDFVANAGGLIYVADELEQGGFNEARVIERVRAIEKTTTNIFKKARGEGLPSYRVADMMAQAVIRSGGYDK